MGQILDKLEAVENKMDRLEKMLLNIYDIIKAEERKRLNHENKHLDEGVHKY